MMQKEDQKSQKLRKLQEELKIKELESYFGAY